MILCLIQLVSGVRDKLWEDIIECAMPKKTEAPGCDQDDMDYFCTSGRGSGNLRLTECLFNCHKKFHPASK